MARPNSSQAHATEESECTISPCNIIGINESDSDSKFQSFRGSKKPTGHVHTIGSDHIRANAFVIVHTEGPPKGRSDSSYTSPYHEAPHEKRGHAFPPWPSPRGRTLYCTEASSATSHAYRSVTVLENTKPEAMERRRTWNKNLACTHKENRHRQPSLDDHTYPKSILTGTDANKDFFRCYPLMAHVSHFWSPSSLSASREPTGLLIRYPWILSQPNILK